MSLKPLKDRVVAIKEQPQDKTPSGILLGEAKEEPNTAIIEAVGPKVESLKKGDKIIYKEYSATEVKLKNKTYLILAEEDILATF